LPPPSDGIREIEERQPGRELFALEETLKIVTVKQIYVYNYKAKFVSYKNAAFLFML
jgi:hypothetical protein